jgi:hypothetical protein
MSLEDRSGAVIPPAQRPICSPADASQSLRRTTGICVLPSFKRVVVRLHPQSASKWEHWVLIPAQHGPPARAILLLAAEDDLQRIVG